MRDIIIGTGNPAKAKMVQDALVPLGITLKTTGDLGISLDIEEDGTTAQENVRKKSQGYAQAAGQAVLSIDNALYLDGLPDDEQPGIHTRRIPGKAGRATDQELLAYFSRRVEHLGGEIGGRWEFAVCIATPRGRVFERTIVSPRRFVSCPSEKMVPGYPLESIQIEPRTRKYIAEMSEEEQAAFWQAVVGMELCEFVERAMQQIE